VKGKISRKHLITFGQVVSAGAFAASLLTVFLGIRPFAFGIWFQSEPSVAAVHFCAGIAALGLVPSVLWDRRDRDFLFHPFVLIPLAIALWSAFSGLFHDLPQMGWFGSQQVGEGVLWYLDLAVFIAAGMILGRSRRMRWFLAVVSVLLVAIISGMTFYSDNIWVIARYAPFFFSDYLASNGISNYVPFFFSDYLAFHGIFIAAVLVAFLRLRRWYAIALVCLFSVIVILVSRNMVTVLMALTMAPIIWAILRWVPWQRQKLRTLGIVAATAVPILITGIVWGSNYVPLPDPNGSWSRIGAPLNSLKSRYHLLKIGTSAISHEPEILAVGKGWGSYTDLFAINLPVEWVNLRDDDDAIWDAWWDAVNRVDFHSHNYLLGTLLAAGVFGFLLVLAFTALLPAWCKRQYVPFATAIAALTGGTAALWFQLSTSLPLMGLAWAGLATPVSWKKKIPKSWGVVGLLVAAPLLIYGGANSWVFAKKAYYYLPKMEAPLLDEGGSRNACPERLDDFGRGGVHQAFRLRTIIKFMRGWAKREEVDEAKGLITKEKVDKLRGLICTSEDYIDKGASFRLVLGSVLVRGDLAFFPEHPLLTPLVSNYLVNWEERLKAALKMAPRRSDISTSYLMWLLSKGENKKFRVFSDWLYARNNNDPVALWFSGIALSGDARWAGEGIKRMRLALENGVQRFFPVEEEVKKSLGFSPIK
jgi:hypothetical protein